MLSKNERQDFTAIIIDDEFHGRENLKKIMELYFPEIKVLGLADSVINGKKLVGQHNPDVVFLDINMPVFDGFDFLEEYDKPNFLTVFVTAYEEFGIKALKAGAVDYLLKPINIKELKQTVKKIFSRITKNEVSESTFEPGKLVLPTSNGFIVIVIDDIIRLEADSCYTKVFSKEGKSLLVSRTLKEFEENLPKDKFFRIHKSHLINLSFIKDYSRLGGFYITMKDGSKIEVSRRKAPDFIKKMKTIINAV
jgi:two-component system LytT family response regulator